MKMMMGGMMGAGFGWLFLLYTLLVLFLILGFAHIIWLMSVKESGSSKLIGQIISIVIVVLVVILFLYGAIYGRGMMKNCMMGQGMMGKDMMMKQEMMKGMEKMTPEMKKMMEKNWKK
ncbi:MAG: hypothetical protein PHG97_04450 [Candidatus Margulisbacteria bacterium]|nr:hypothetical protein [Candidatus Margulisiibacteriota bacterium]